ncbi:Bug family tripartite tricarboxylate transporter substrate binding protein [Plastoroseomonas hellenica]|uniref:Bug family tripartite tricarboxylate transporter substrate binding protein n=1 Tax=Plastoroseomonas hellenica TaxID=2687306 RepID=UPI001BA8E00E|nr:tripartite tricarboxylate transporter substrate binding protein [Plastoroseomonas hellenica]MBR0646969.1 tripartite tricarboxylate transporter substrate binding protein [Plastoroseomonas hellenica]
MRFARRRTLFALAGLTPALATPALAQADWPTRPIRMVIPYPPGGASDIIARLLAPHMTELLGQVWVVENRPGANGFIAAEHVARSAPDGYTLLMGNAGPNGTGPALYGSRTPYDAIRDFSAIMAVSVVPLVMAVHPAVPVRSFPEFIAHAREIRGRLSYGTAGVGSAGHMGIELLKSLTDIEMTHVPYRGSSPLTSDLIAGTVPLSCDTAPVLLPHAQAGRVRTIAVTAAQRIPEAPELATVSETVPGFETVSWGGVMGPAGLPPPIVARLNTALNTAMARPQVGEALQRQGIQPQRGTPEAFATYVAAEVRKWTGVVQQMGLRPE